MINFCLQLIAVLLPIKSCIALTWQSIPSNLPQAMDNLCVGVSNEEIVYAFGGRIYNNPQQKSWKYDTLNGWQDIAVTLPKSNMFCGGGRGVVTENNVIYFFGVYNSDPGAIYAFDANTESFITHNIPSPPIQSGYLTAKDKNNNLIFLVGGGELQILDLNTNQWTQNLPSVPNSGALYFDANTQNLFTFGGRLLADNSLTNQIWKYSIIDNQWTILPATLSESKSDAESILANDGNVYIFGGYSGGASVHSKVDAFNVKDWSITPQINLPEARTSVVSAYIDNKIMYWGGYGNVNGNTALWNSITWYYTGYMTEELLPSSTCEEDGEIKHINWNQLQNAVNNSAEIPNYNFALSFDSNSLQLTVDIDLEYLGTSTDGDFNNDYNLGTTYVIDFQSFGTQDRINETGNCENRMYSSFQAGTFDQWWNYSEYPYLSSDDLGSETYLSYPPPTEYWTLSIPDFTCSPIHYHGIFSWNELSECTDFGTNNLNNVVDDGVSITLSGTLYINVVSPYSMEVTDSGIYRTFPLIQQDFSISILKQINVLSSTGIELFIASIIGIYEDETDGSFELSILTQSADYILLTNPNIISTPLGSATITSVTSTCLVASSYTCGQIFTVTIDSTQITCPPADFSGLYKMLFTVTCPGNEAVCNTFIDDNNGTSITLEVTSNFIDNTCDPSAYQVIFNGNMEFYDDDSFATIHDGANGDNNYVIGQDTIYVEVVVNFPDDGTGDNFAIFGIEIDNVFVCTAADGIDLTLNLDQQNGAGGCLSSNIDPDGPYNVITDGVVNTVYQTQIISNSGTSNIVRFSFLTFDIGRITMYIHTQLTLVLQSGTRRRLQLLQTSDSDGTSHQIRHFIASTGVSEKIVSETIHETTRFETDLASKLSISLFSTILILFLLSTC